MVHLRFSTSKHIVHSAARTSLTPLIPACKVSRLGAHFASTIFENAAGAPSILFCSMMHQPATNMAAPLSLDRRPTSAFPQDFVAGADSDPRYLAAGQPFASESHPHHPHQQQIFSHSGPDFAAGYNYTSTRAPYDQQLSFDATAPSHVPAWFYQSNQDRPSQNVSDAVLPFSLDSYPPQTNGASATSNNLSAPPVPSLSASAAERGAPAAPATAPATAGLHAVDPSEAAPFAVSAAGNVSSVSLSSALPPPAASERRSSDDSVHNMVNTGLPMIDAHPPPRAVPMSIAVRAGSEAAGFNGSLSPTSSARMSGSPEALASSNGYSHYVSASTGPPAGMVIGTPMSSSVLASIDSWLAPAPPATISSNTNAGGDVSAAANSTSSHGTTRNISPAGGSAASSVPSSTRVSTGAAFHPGSTSNDASASSSAAFKTSVERRERNKASQRESRKRKQDRMETLESENAALRKALADMKKFSHALSNGAGIRGADGAEVAPIQLTKFTGAFHLDLIESHLEDESAEAEWKGMIGHRFPAQTSSAQDWDGPAFGAASSASDSDEEHSREDAEGSANAATQADSTQASRSIKFEGPSSVATEKVKSSLAPSQPDSQAGKKATWEISLNQKRQKAAQSFPSMVAVPELVLYKVCRLYFSTLLPFTTKLKSGIINLRAAREAPGFIGGMDDLPRFPGDPSFVGEEFYLPRNLMPTEMQMRIGFHPVEIAVLPYPAMRDRVLTILSAFHAIEELAQAEEDAARFTDESSSDKSQGNSGGTRASSAEETELNEEDIRKRTALVADMSAWKPKEASGAVVIPDKSRIYSYGFLEKPKGSHRLRKPAQRWLDEFFYAIVQTLRVWSPAGDVFDGECFEFKESFFRKYPYMVDGEILRATNRWRRARGEDPIRL